MDENTKAKAYFAAGIVCIFMAGYLSHYFATRGVVDSECLTDRVEFFLFNQTQIHGIQINENATIAYYKGFYSAKQPWAKLGMRTFIDSQLIKCTT